LTLTLEDLKNASGIEGVYTLVISTLAKPEKILVVSLFSAFGFLSLRVNNDLSSD
jgi:hypothetical protein